MPPAKLTAVVPSDCRNVRLIWRVSPRITLLIVFPSFAIDYPPYRAPGDGLAEADGELDALGDCESEAELDGLSEAEGERDADGEIEALADGESEADGLREADGDGEADADTSAKADTRFASMLRGFQIAVNLIRPLVIVLVPTVVIIS